MLFTKFCTHIDSVLIMNLCKGEQACDLQKLIKKKVQVEEDANMFTAVCMFQQHVGDLKNRLNIMIQSQS